MTDNFEPMRKPRPPRRVEHVVAKQHYRSRRARTHVTEFYRWQLRCGDTASISVLNRGGGAPCISVAVFRGSLRVRWVYVGTDDLPALRQAIALARKSGWRGVERTTEQGPSDRNALSIAASPGLIYLGTFRGSTQIGGTALGGTKLDALETAADYRDELTSQNHRAIGT